MLSQLMLSSRYVCLFYYSDGWREKEVKKAAKKTTKSSYIGSGDLTQGNDTKQYSSLEIGNLNRK